MEEEPQFSQNYDGKAGPRSPDSLRIMENVNSKQHDKLGRTLTPFAALVLTWMWTDLMRVITEVGVLRGRAVKFCILGGHLFIPETSAKCVFCAWGFRDECGAVSALKTLSVVFESGLMV